MQAAWGVWPAGYLVTFGFAMRADPSAGPSADPATSSPPAPTSAADIPAWPAGIDLPVGNHLLLIGINTPLDYHVRTARLTRLGPDAAGTVVPLIRPTSPWPLHFTVIGVDGGFGAERPAVLAAGHLPAGPGDRSGTDRAVDRGDRGVRPADHEPGFLHPDRRGGPQRGALTPWT